MSKFILNTIESAVHDIKKGKIVIVIDDKNRENEGDFLASAELISPEIINFMATHGRGLICAPITESIARRLKLDLMVVYRRYRYEKGSKTSREYVLMHQISIWPLPTFIYIIIHI